MSATSTHVSNPALSDEGISSPVMVVTVVGDDDEDDDDCDDDDNCDADRCCLTKSSTIGLAMMLGNRRSMKYEHMIAGERGEGWLV